MKVKALFLAVFAFLFFVASIYSQMANAEFSNTFQLSSSAGDAQQADDNTGFTSIGTTILVRSEAGAARRTNAGLRFANINIPQGATITSAVLNVSITSTSVDSPYADIYANAVDNANDFTSEASVNNRVRTSAAVLWNQVDVGTGYKPSPNIASVIQEIVNRSGWASGNSIALLLDGKPDQTRVLSFRAFDGYGIAGSARLVINYSTDPDTTPPIITNIQESSISSSSGTISWITDDSSNSTVNYGLTQSLGSTETDASLVTSHSIVLTGLNQDTLYYYQITSCNQDNYCSSSAIDSFTTLPSVPVVTQRIKGAAYKPNYGSGETVEFAAAVMDSRLSIENNLRFVGVNDWNLSYRVLNPDGTTYQDWQDIVVSNSWAIGRFNLSTAQTGTFTIQLKLANTTPTPTENITFSVSGSNTVPFYRNEIIKAADYIVSIQSPDGSFPSDGGYSAPGSPARVLMWAYKITGNITYYNAAVNYLEDQISCSQPTDNTLYGTCAYADFQAISSDSRFASNLNTCSAATYNLRYISPYYVEKGEASYCLYRTWEATGDPNFKSYGDDMVNSILSANSWDATKNTWYFSDQTYRDGIFTGTLTAFGLPWYAPSTYLNNAIAAQNLFVPQFYQDHSFGPDPASSFYSFEIDGGLASGHFPHFTAEPALAMTGLYKATQNRDWLLKASLPAKWIAQSQEPDGHFEDNQSSQGDIWATMWAAWGLSEFPKEVSVEVADINYNLTISSTAWNESDDKLSANVSVPAGQIGKVRFITPENATLTSVLVDGAPATSYVQDGRKVVVDVTEGNHLVEALWGTVPQDIIPPVRSNAQPSGVLPSGTTQTNLTLDTNEPATCRYSTTAGIAYSSMTDTFSTTGGATHSTLATGLTDGSAYSYYVRCQDEAGNPNANDLDISFSVSSATTTVVSSITADAGDGQANFYSSIWSASVNQIALDADDRAGSFRFANVSLPEGAIIVNAFIRLESAAARSGVFNLTVSGFRETNSLQIANFADWNVRPVTTSTSPWQISSPASLQILQSSDISSIVQEIYNLGERNVFHLTVKSQNSTDLKVSDSRATVNDPQLSITYSIQ